MPVALDPATDALAIVDLQPAFMRGGSLPTPGGTEVVPVVNRLLRLPFGFRFATQDWHPPGHVSFASSHRGAAPNEVVRLESGPLTVWPDHALQGTREARLHRRLDTTLVDLVFRKGVRLAADGLSAFGDRGGRTTSGLAALLRERGIRRVVFAGLALDVCVAASAIDAAQAGFASVVVLDACRASRPDRVASTRQRLEHAGVVLVGERDLA